MKYFDEIVNFDEIFIVIKVIMKKINRTKKSPIFILKNKKLTFKINTMSKEKSGELLTN